MKKIHMERNATDSEFPYSCPAFFYEKNWLLATLNLTQLHVNFDFLSVRGTAISVVSFATVTWSRQATSSLHREIEGVV